MTRRGAKRLIRPMALERTTTNNYQGFYNAQRSLGALVVVLTGASWG